MKSVPLKFSFQGQSWHKQEQRLWKISTLRDEQWCNSSSTREVCIHINLGCFVEISKRIWEDTKADLAFFPNEELEHDDKSAETT